MREKNSTREYLASREPTRIGNAETKTFHEYETPEDPKLSDKRLQSYSNRTAQDGNC